MRYKCVRCGVIKEVKQPMRTCKGACRTWYSRYIANGGTPLEMIRIDESVTPRNADVTLPQNPLPEYENLLNTVREIWSAVSRLELRLSEPMTFAFQGQGVAIPMHSPPMYPPKPLQLDAIEIEVKESAPNSDALVENFLASLQSIDF
jgi:hypothetical protein